MTSHALLLRLFLSPSFFSVHVALRYLLLYSDNIGITYYLAGRLKQVDIRELREVWGFICHLLVTRPSKSRALECFVLEIAQRSTHIAMMTLWFMQAALRDLSTRSHNSPSFIICQRILNRCHEIIFDDISPPSSSPYAGLKIPSQSLLMRRKVKPNVEPAVVGVGVVLAGAPGMPQLADLVGQIAIEQGRVEHTTGVRSLESQNEEYFHGHRTAPQAEDLLEDEQDIEESSDRDEVPPDSLSVVLSPSPISNRDPKRKIGAAQTVPALPLHLNLRPFRASQDPLGQLDVEPPKLPYLSTPSIPSAQPSLRSANLNPADALLEKYDKPAQTQLLRSHYCRSEIQFLLSLENISNRLLIVPRPARVSALRAELTALNHKLPAEVCIPMWCPSSDTVSPSTSLPQAHHRIVRIPPGESVVLNSAERAPYLLLIEILHDDLDFDPNKRNNKEILKKIVTKENEKAGASKDLIPFDERSGATKTNFYIHHAEPSTPSAKPPSLTGLPPQTPSTGLLTGDEEEIDLVEQLYGPNQSLRSGPVDLTDSIVLPPPPKNKDLDMAAWSKSSPLPHSPAIENGPLLSQGRPRSELNGNEPSQNLSLDEYSERMRTAAIMLAQLNLTLTVNTPVSSTALSAQPDFALRSSPLETASTLNAEQSSSRGAFSFGVPDPPSQTWSRSKLQYSEASAIRERIMQEMLALEEERMARMAEDWDDQGMAWIGDVKSAEDENIIRRELDKADPSAVVFSESWATKKSRIRHASPYGHLANWDCMSVIVKTGGDLRQEQLAVQLIQEFQRIWEEEKCACWVRYFRILITGGTSGLVETITDAVSIHSLKKAEYARRIAEGRFGHVTLMDHFKTTYGDPSSAKFARAQRNFAKSLAGYSLVTYLLQIKDRHNGNILLDREGHLIHIDFGFILSNTPGNIGFEAAPFKLPAEYVEVLGGVNGTPFLEFRRLFREGFEAARKHCDRIITLVELMQKDSTLPCFAAFGEQTASLLRDRFQPVLTHSLVANYVDRLIDSSLGSHWTRLYDSYQYYSQSIL